MDDPNTGVGGLFVELFDAVTDERRSPREVEIGAGLHTGRHQRKAVAGVRPDGRDDDPGASAIASSDSGDPASASMIGQHRGGFTEGGSFRAHLLHRPAGESDPCRSAGPGQVFGGERADKSGSVEDEVEFALRHGRETTPVTRAKLKRDINHGQKLPTWSATTLRRHTVVSR